MHLTRFASSVPGRSLTGPTQPLAVSEAQRCCRFWCRSASEANNGPQPSTSASSNGLEPQQAWREDASMQRARSSRRAYNSRQPPAQQQGSRQQGLNTADGDPFASFRAYQQAAALQAAGIGQAALDAGMRPDQGWMPSSPPRLRPLTRRGWQVQPGYTFQTLYEEVLRSCERKQPGAGIGPLFLLIKLAETRDDARMALDAIAAIRTSLARKGSLAPLSPRLCALFAQMCYTCDSPDVLAEALHRTNELGLVLSHNRVHDVLRSWGAALELYKMEKVLAAMESGGMPPTTKTAYIMVRAAVNAGRLDKAEAYVKQMSDKGVRLHHSTLRLLETGQRAQQSAAVGARADQAAGVFYGSAAGDEGDGPDDRGRY